MHAAIPELLDSKNGGIVYKEFKVRFATYRTDNGEILGQVGSRYEIVQNKDAFGFFDSIIDSGEAIFETAGALGNGERIFVTAKLPEDMLVGGEPCNKYIILTNSHNGSSSIIAGFTTVRIVCSNTLQAALSKISNKYSIQHRIGAREKLSEAYRVMNISSMYMKQLEDNFNRMVDVKMNEKELNTYITDVMRPVYSTKDDRDSTMLKNQVSLIQTFALTHATQTTEAANGTLWGAYNAISGYYNYIKKDSAESQLFGNASNKINKAYQKAEQLILS